jgi:hypothetical protein
MEEGKVECVIKNFKCYHTKEKDNQTVTFINSNGKEFIECYGLLNWGTSMTEL